MKVSELKIAVNKAKNEIKNGAKDKRIESLKRTNNELASDGLKHGSSKAGSYMANKRYGK